MKLIDLSLETYIIINKEVNFNHVVMIQVKIKTIHEQIQNAHKFLPFRAHFSRLKNKHRTL